MGKGKGKVRRPKNGKGKVRHPKKEKGKGRKPFCDPIPLRNQTARTHARTHAWHDTERFPGWTHPPTSDLTIIYYYVIGF